MSKDLARVVDELDVPVMAFGPQNDFRNELFEGSKHLLLLADKIEEIKTICQYCSRKATMVLQVPKQVNLSMMESRSRSVDTRPISPFAASIILIQTFQLKASRTF